MTTEKYYTPDISEFYVGFQFEEFGHNGSSTKEWFPKTLTHDELMWERHGTDGPFDNSLAKYRVKFLDRADIESLGWKQSWSEKGELSFEIDRYILTYIEASTRIIITDLNKNQQTPCGYFHWPLFDGNIKNKSELKKLMQQIGI